MLAWVMNLGFAGSQAAPPPVTGGGVSGSTISKSSSPGGTQFRVSGAHVTRDTSITEKLP